MIYYKIIITAIFGFKESAVVVGLQDNTNQYHYIIKLEVSSIITADSIVSMLTNLPKTTSNKLIVASNLDFQNDLKNSFKVNKVRYNFDFMLSESLLAEQEYLQLLYSFMTGKITTSEEKVKDKIDKRLRGFDIKDPDNVITSLALLRSSGKAAAGAMKLEI